MRRNNKLIGYLIITVCVVFGVWISIGGFPVIITRDDCLNSQNNTIDSIITNPIMEYDLSKGNMEMVLIMSADDIDDLPMEMPKRRVLYCNDQKIMKNLQHAFSFEESGGDMATVESELLVFYNDTPAFYHAGDCKFHQSCCQISMIFPERKPLERCSSWAT